MSRAPLRAGLGPLKVTTTRVALDPTSPLSNWTWRGFEVIGAGAIPRDEILKNIPIKPGEPYREDRDAWKAWAAELKQRFGLAYAACTAVRFSPNFDAYLVIELVEAGAEHRIRFRPAPQGSVPLATGEVNRLYDRLYERMWELFNQGKPAKETAENGYLDYSDPQMQELVRQLVKEVPPLRENLLSVLEHEKNEQSRERAANLLNWSVHDLGDSIVRASQLLDDPGSTVRNNISRFTLHFVDRLEGEGDRRRVIDQLLIQLDRPTHGDRNKALYNLLALARTFPADLGYMKEKGAPLIRELAYRSILSNVRDPAVELVKLLEGSSSFAG